MFIYAYLKSDYIRVLDLFLLFVKRCRTAGDSEKYDDKKKLHFEM